MLAWHMLITLSRLIKSRVAKQDSLTVCDRVKREFLLRERERKGVIERERDKERERERERRKERRREGEKGRECLLSASTP